MKILHVMAGGRHGGAETAFVDMCCAQQERPALEVEVITRPNDVRIPRLQDAGIKVHFLPFGTAIDLYTPWKIKQIIRRFQPDIIQSWLARAPSKVPQWMPQSSIPRYIHVARLGGEYNMKYFKSCDAFAAVTPELATYIKSHGIASARVRQINNFAEVEAIKNPLRRSDYGVPDDAVLLLGLGRLHDDKAFDILIRAVAELPQNFYLWIAGEGPLHGKLQALINKLNLQERITLLGWQSDRAALFAQADICTFISRDEPFGTVFVQSWALDTPVIVSDADGPRQFVRDGEDGLIVPRDDVDATVRAVLKLAGDPALQKTVIANGKKRYLEGFTKQTSVDAYLDFYQTLLESR